MTVATVVALVFGVGIFALRQALVDTFTCDHLITDRVGAPSLICDGGDPVPEVAKDVASAAKRGFYFTPAGWVVSRITDGGKDGNTESDGNSRTHIAGLEVYLDPPLNQVRRLVIWIGLFVAVAVSGFATFVMNRVEAFVALLRFDPLTWKRISDSSLRFAFVFIMLSAASYLLLS